MTNTENPRFIWHNHELRRWEDATVHLTENWWPSVTAVFEGIRGYWNPRHNEIYIFRLHEHLKRLENSMRLVRLDDNFPAEELRSATAELVKANDYRGDVYIMPLAYGVGGKSFGRATDRQTHLFIYSRPTSSRLDEDYSISVGVSSWGRIHEKVMPPRAKAISNYRNSQLASYEASMNGYDQALMLNPEGKVAEGPGSCAFFVRGGKIFTPDLASGLLESITRDTVIQLAREQISLVVEERSVDRTEAYLADEAFLCGTNAEITPIASIDHFELRHGAPGPITRQIRDLYREVVRGYDSRFNAWRTPVSFTADETESIVATRSQAAR